MQQVQHLGVFEPARAGLGDQVAHGFGQRGLAAPLQAPRRVSRLHARRLRSRSAGFESPTRRMQIQSLQLSSLSDHRNPVDTCCDTHRCGGDLAMSNPCASAAHKPRSSKTSSPRQVLRQLDYSLSQPADLRRLTCCASDGSHTASVSETPPPRVPCCSTALLASPDERRGSIVSGSQTRTQ